MKGSLKTTGISITNKFEIRDLYIPNDRSIKYEILTFERYDGVVRSTAHAYENEYKNRRYMGQRISINSCHDLDFSSINNLHDKAKSILKKYHLTKKTYLNPSNNGN